MKTKLVRDHIPDIIKLSGKQCKYFKVNSKDQHMSFLKEKMVEELEEFSLLISEVIFTLLFLTVLVFRFTYMRSVRSRMPQINMPVPLLLLARTVHLGIYASLTLIAITGLLIGGLYHSGMKTGFLLEIVLLSHEIFFWVSINLMGLHIAGAVYHRLKGDGVWSAMVPIFKEKV